MDPKGLISTSMEETESTVSDTSLEECTNKNISKENNNDTKSEYIKRESKYQNKKRLSYNSNQMKILKNITSDSFFKKPNQKNKKKDQKSYYRSKNAKQSSFSSDERPQENLCQYHNKVLDMVCEQDSCMMPVCSSCILFGEHKNHQYTQLEIFLENLESVKKNIKGVAREIQKSRNQIEQSHQKQKILPKVEEIQSKLEASVQKNCERSVQEIMRKKEDALTEIKYFFQSMKTKLEKYSSESLEFIKCNEAWEKSFEEVFQELNDSPNSVEEGFRFLESINEKKIFMKGQNILDNFSEMQLLLNNKMKECLGSFTIQFSHPDLQFFDIKKREISFKNDLRKKMKICSDSINDLDEVREVSEHKDHQMHLMQANSNCESDRECYMDENLDVLNSNLMSGLNLLTEKVLNHASEFNEEETIMHTEPRPFTERTMNISYPLEQHGQTDRQIEDALWRQNTYSTTMVPDENHFVKGKPKKLYKCNSNKKFMKSEKSYKHKSKHDKIYKC